jgi:uncharacterized membrane protein
MDIINQVFGLMDPWTLASLIVNAIAATVVPFLAVKLAKKGKKVAEIFLAIEDLYQVLSSATADKKVTAAELKAIVATATKLVEDIKEPAGN